jgi:outer membrane receptor protein involved in Fe transport
VRADLNRTLRAVAATGGICLALLPTPGAGHQDITAPETHIVGHYETGIGTSDAASEGGVTYKRIDTRPLLRTGEVLELVPGLIATQHSGDGKANQYFLRGYNLDHGTDFAIWVDGMPVNMPTHGHGQGYADINFMIPELVSRIGFRKGPYFAEEGDFSSAGVARIRYFDRMPAGVAQVTLGEFGFARGVFANSSEVAGGSLLYAVEAVGNDGPWENPQNLKKYNGVLRFSHGDEQTGFSVSLMGFDSKWTATDQIARRAVDTGQLGLFGTLDPTTGGDTSRYSLSFSGRSRVGENSSLRADAYVMRYSLDLWSNFTYFLSNPTLGDQFLQADRRTVYGFNPSYAWATKLLGRESVTTVGLQSRFDDISRVALYSSVGRQVYDTTREDSVDQASAGIYMQNSTQWSPWFRSLVGLRGDYYRFDVASSIPENSGRRNDNIVSPKLSLVFGPWSKTEYFVNAGYGFHSNDGRGAVIRVDPVTRSPVDPVNPLVRTRGAEVGVRTEIVPNLQSSLALWMLRQDSELLFVGDAGTTEASRPSERQGIEWINYARPTSWLLVDAELALTRARFSDNDPAGDRIPGALNRVATLGLTVDGFGKWFGAIQVRHFGPRPLTEDGSEMSKSTTLTNLRVGYALSKGIQLRADVLNLFGSKRDDMTYFYPSCLRSEVGVHPDCPAGGGGAGVPDQHFRPVEPRQLRVSVVARF